MKTYTFAGGSITPGFVLSKVNEKRDNKSGTVQALVLGEYSRGSYMATVLLNHNPDNRPEVVDNIVRDAFLYNVVEGSDRPIFILSRDLKSRDGTCLIRFITVGKDGKGNGYTSRISGFRSRELVGGHGRNHAVLSANGTWADSVWVAYEGELLRVQLAGCDTAFAVRVKNSVPMVEPWVERQPRSEKPKDQPAVKPVESVSGNGNGRHGGNPHRMMPLKGSHVVPVVEWSPSPDGVNDAPAPKIELDAELAKLGADRVARFNGRYNQQSVAA